MKHNSFLFISVIFFTLAGCRNSHNTSENKIIPIPVVTEITGKINTATMISLSGNVEGYKTVRLGFLVAGKIDFIAIDEGQMIKKGQLLSSLDPASYAIAKELADIQVNQTEDEYNRLRLMHENNSLSESDFAKISYGLQLAKAQQKLHTKNLSDTKLYSPIDGVLLKKLGEVGEITGVGIPLFVVSDIRKIKVVAYVPETELHKIKIGQKAGIQLPSAGKTYEGKVIEVGSAADAASRAFSVKIEVANPELLIRPGMIAEVKINPENVNEVLAVPAGSILHDYDNQSFVFIADTVKHQAFRRNVIPGKLINEKIEIISGLNDNEIIVTGGQQKLFDGSFINIIK